MVFVADDLAAWLVGMLADAGRKRLTTLVLVSDHERALRQAATAAVQLTATELRPDGGERAEELAMVVSHVFREAPTGGSAKRAGDAAGSAAGGNHPAAGSFGRSRAVRYGEVLGGRA